MTRTIDLLAACDQGDEVRLEQLGWRPVLDALRAWPKRLDGRELAPYARLLGDADPQAVADAILAFAGETPWRPGAAQVSMRLAPAESEHTQGRHAQPRSDQGAHVYAAVLAAVAAGEHTCNCMPHPTTILINGDGVLHCPHCRGLEPGQVDEAIDNLRLT